MEKKIVLFIPSIEGGGVEKNLFLISEYLSKNYKNIYIVTADRKFKSFFNKKISVICPKSNQWESKSRFKKTIIAILLLINNFMNKEIVLISFQSNTFVILISKIFGYKILIRLNTSIKKYINTYFKKIFFKFFYNFADEIIVNSKSFKKEIKKYLNLNSILIYNLNKSNKKKNKLKFFERFKGLKILNIGRLTDQKDQIVLLKSLKLLLKKKIKFRCCIIGDGIKKKSLNAYIESENLDKHIKLLGYKKNAESYLNSCDLFVLTSKFEGLPNVLIEAQNNNIPIISTDCPTGPREILINGKLGDLFKVGDYKKLFNKLLNFNENKKMLINKSKKAKNYIKRFESNLNGKKYNSLISKYY